MLLVFFGIVAAGVMFLFPWKKNISEKKRAFIFLYIISAGVIIGLLANYINEVDLIGKILFSFSTSMVMSGAIRHIFEA